MFKTTFLTQSELTFATKEFQIEFFALNYTSTGYTSKHFYDPDGLDSLQELWLSKKVRHSVSILTASWTIVLQRSVDKWTIWMLSVFSTIHLHRVLMNRDSHVFIAALLITQTLIFPKIFGCFARVWSSDCLMIRMLFIFSEAGCFSLRMSRTLLSPFSDARSNEYSFLSVSVERVDAFYCFMVSGLSFLNWFRISCGDSLQSRGSGFSKQTETALMRRSTSSRSLGSMMFKPSSRTGSEKISRHFRISTQFPIRFGRRLSAITFPDTFKTTSRFSWWNCKSLLHCGGKTFVVILRGHFRVISNFFQDVTMLAFFVSRKFLLDSSHPTIEPTTPKASITSTSRSRNFCLAVGMSSDFVMIWHNVS